MPTREVTTKFYKFHQNNSGGSYHIDEERGIGGTVFIEAVSDHAANDVARRIGMLDLDYCPCCGEHFTPAYGDYEAYEAPLIEEVYDWMRSEPIFVHYLDGRVEKISE